MNPRAMAALRMAATLAHTLLDVRVRVRDGERVVLEVMRPPLAEGAVLTPCAFRAAVTRGHEQVKDGAALAFMGIADESALAVDVGLPPGSRTLPGGVHQLVGADAVVYLFATALPRRHVRGAVARVDGATVQQHFDAATEVTLLYTAHAREGAPDRCPELDAVLEAITADELVHEVAVGAAKY